MPSDFRFLTLEITRFRGVRDSMLFDLDGSVVLLHGPNGTGKTSFFDALQWLFLGSIERLSAVRRRKNTEHIVNVYKSQKKARVVADVLLNGKRITLSRTGNYKNTTFEISGAAPAKLYGREAKEWLALTLLPHHPEALDKIFMVSGLLEQDEVRSVLQASAKDRYDQISILLGLRDLQRFEDEAREAANKAAKYTKQARDEFKEAEESVEIASVLVKKSEQEVAQLKPIEAYTEELSRLIKETPPHIQVELPTVPDTAEAFIFAQNCRQLSRSLKDGWSTLNEVQAELDGLDARPSDEQTDEAVQVLEEHTTVVEKLEADLGNAQELLRSAERDSQRVARLAAAAIPLLGECCPVCEQSIDPERVEARLHEISTGTAELIQHREAVNEAAAQVKLAQERRNESKVHLDVVQQAHRIWKELQQRKSQLKTQLSDICRETSEPVRFDALIPDEVVPDEVVRSLPSIIKWLNRFASSLEVYHHAVVGLQRLGDLERSRSELTEKKRNLEHIRKALGEAEAHEKDHKSLLAATTEARIKVTERLFETIEPLVADIYSRLDPHPTFTDIRFQHERYYRRGESHAMVSDAAAEVEADPLVVFSSSQANAAALSCFLAMGLGASGRPLPFVMLDDPLQAMDDINVLGFADLCRFLRTRKQLIVSTHDRRFADLLRRKLAPRDAEDRTVVHEFIGWHRQGPTVKTAYPSYETDIEQLLVQLG
ncbi:MAG: AAA family ATPase [Acidimicrobiaceae bacterium]|nr:AAA family ATPase [Acidimicrobiaceae bacterium]